MRYFFGLWTVLALAALPAAAVDPALLKLVPPGARVLAGVDMDKCKASPFGMFVLERISNGDADFRTFIEATGFDPRRDLKELLFASEAGPGRDRGVVLARGVFDLNRIAEFARRDGAAVSSYAGTTVIEGKKGRGGLVALLDGSTAMAGDAESVRKALDARTGSAGPDPAVSGKAAALSAAHHAWALSLVGPADIVRRTPDPQVNAAMKADAFRGIEQASGGVRFGSMVEVSGEAVARSDQDATAIVDTVRFLAGMVQMNREKDGAALIAPMLDSLQIKSRDRTVTLFLSIPEQDLEKLIESKPRPRKTANL